MSAPTETCDHCGSANLTWRKCKQLCLDCGNVNRSCADLRTPAAEGGARSVLSRTLVGDSQ